jgi:two-component system, chemotaxis family, chemotaxis protein CheY
MMTRPNITTVLVIEDDDANRAYLVNRLRALKVEEVLESSSLAEGRCFIATVQFDLILCDWYLGDQSGLDLFKEMQSSPSTKNIPFIMVTGEREKGKVMEALKVGVTDYIVKPFSQDLLRSKLEKFIPRLSKPS